MFTYREIETLVAANIQSYMAEDICVLEDIDTYEMFLELKGYEPMAKELYTNKVAMCCQGEIGHMTMWSCNPKYIHFMEQFWDKIILSQSLMASALYEGEKAGYIKVDVRTINLFVLGIIAHERRHAVQPMSMYEPFQKDLAETDPAAYLKLKHEADAEAFAAAVIHGEATLEEAASWNIPW